MNEHTQARMVEVVKKFLDGEFNGDKWNYKIHNDIAFSGCITGISTLIDKLIFYIIVGEETVTCYHIALISIPEEQRVAVNEFITRANYGLLKGNFEMGFRDGELRYKNNVSQYDLLSNDTAAFHSMQTMMLLGPLMWKRYGDNLTSLFFGFPVDKSVADLVRQSETAE